MNKVLNYLISIYCKSQYNNIYYINLIDIVIPAEVTVMGFITLDHEDRMEDFKNFN